ncbi:serine hydrolase [Sphingobium sp. Sx8-8]|uniref:serine hydrolase n=1 Tax=Sphingobium sp. Sx8-8 TaxID=2933617 RepID=UPI001F577764|nr:serine hydrolase [Sphingobium sp. Sx8-8]
MIGPDSAEALRSLLEPHLAAARVPGCGIAIVQPGQPPITLCYGIADLASGEAFAPTTSFPIASTSKAVNATMIATLVAGGLLDWDKPVRDYLPYFRLADEAAAARATLRDLIVMRAGLPRHDWAWLANPQSRAELTRSAAHLQMSAAFRERFQYSNVSVTIAGHVAEYVTGETWESLVATRILDPLGMTQTHFGCAADMISVAGYHEDAARTLVAGERFATECTGPSGGSIHSTLLDMAKWLAFNLTGQADILGAGQLAALHAPHVVIGHRALAAFAPDAAYGLGWAIDHVSGARRVHHSGLLHDVSTSVMLVPERSVGSVCVTNLIGPLPAEFLNGCVLDYLVHGRDPGLALQERQVRYEQLIDDNQRRLARLPRVPDTHPSHELTAYAGRYSHPGYGELEIQLGGIGLVLQRGQLRLALEHWHYDAWIAAERYRWAAHASNPFDRSGQVRFAMGDDGAIDAVSLSLEPGIDPIRFARTRAADGAMSAPARSPTTV